jgi:hypothetical protein
MKLPRTQVEKMIRHQRQRQGLVVPLLEDFMKHPVNIESQEDADWIHNLVQTMIKREERRRGEDKVFSPSSLASCLRQVYLLKNFKELGIPKVYTGRVEPNFYFLHGNFLHIKWQFVLYKMNKVTDDDDFRLIAVEYPLISKRGDHGGTIDVVCEVDREPLIADFKGWNVRDFGKATRGEISHDSRIQSADYGMLYNASKERTTRKVKRVLLLIENKGGPDNGHPIALHEFEIDVKANLPEVRSRLEVLRTYEQTNTIPPPECESTRSLQFKDCPFRKFCKEEVKEIERGKSNGSNSSEYKLAVPPRRGANRSRRNSKS